MEAATRGRRWASPAPRETALAPSSGESPPPSSGGGGGGGGGNLWLRGADVEISGVIEGPTLRVDAHEYDGPEAERGTTAGLPGRLELVHSAGGLVTLTNNSLQARTVRLVVSQ